MAAHGFNLVTRSSRICARLHVVWWRLAGALGRSRDESAGVAAIECGLLAAGISVVVVANVVALGPMVDAAFQTVLDRISDAPVSG